MSMQLSTRGLASAKAALLTISNLRLLVPQSEIRAVEAASAVDVRDAEAPSVGWLEHGHGRWPVYSLSAELLPVAEAAAARRTCVLLGSAGGAMGILCDEVGIVEPPDQVHDLPPAMRLRDTPVLGLAGLGEEGIVCVTSAEALARHVARLTEAR